MKTQNVNKQPPKGKIKFSITLSEEQKSKTEYYIIHIILLWVKKVVVKHFLRTN